MTSVLIKKPHIKDFLEVAKLDRESWGDDGINKFIPDGEHAWRIWVEYGLVSCCYKDSQIIGAALAFPTILDLFVVHKVFIKSTEQGKGYGTALLMALVTEMDKRKVDSFLTVNPNNEAAITVYKKIGYKESKFCRGFYREEEDRLIVVRHFEER